MNQIQVMPNDRWELQAEVMTMMAVRSGLEGGELEGLSGLGSAEGGGAIGGEGYFMNGDLGRKFIEHGLSLGIPNFAIHKGLPIPGFDVEHNQPIEIGDLAKAYPEGNFIIYHSGIGANGGSLLNLASLETQPFDETQDRPDDASGCRTSSSQRCARPASRPRTTRTSTASSAARGAT